MKNFVVKFVFGHLKIVRRQMKKYFTPAMIISAIAFVALSGYAFFRAEPILGLSLCLAGIVVCFSVGTNERLRIWHNSARTDAARYRELWELECTKNALTTGEKKTRRDHTFN